MTFVGAKLDGYFRVVNNGVFFGDGPFENAQT